MSQVRLTLVVLVVASLSGCATYEHHVHKARASFKKSPEKAIKLLEPKAKKSGKDQLVYLLDYATALQVAGQYQKSVDHFLKADAMADYKDYHSISKQTASVLLNQGQVQYKGEDYEKILLNAMLAINFLMLKDREGALVETRRVNEKLEYFRTEQKRSYHQNVFAIYLGAMIWEAQRNWTDAYIAYKQAYDLNSKIPYLKEDLMRLARFADRNQAYKKWSSKFNKKWNPKWNPRKYGELVLIYQQGWAPRKRPNPESPRLPILRPTSSATTQAALEIHQDKKIKETTQLISSVEKVALRSFKDQYAALAAKRAASMVAKEVVADQIRQKNKALGDVAGLVMHLSDRADLRQWSSLPESFQVARVRLPAGEYEYSVNGLNAKGLPTGESQKVRKVNIQAGETRFIHWRSFQ